MTIAGMLLSAVVSVLQRSELSGLTDRFSSVLYAGYEASLPVVFKSGGPSFGGVFWEVWEERPSFGQPPLQLEKAIYFVAMGGFSAGLLPAGILVMTWPPDMFKTSIYRDCGSFRGFGTYAFSSAAFIGGGVQGSFWLPTGDRVGGEKAGGVWGVMQSVTAGGAWFTMVWKGPRDRQRGARIEREVRGY